MSGHKLNVRESRLQSSRNEDRFLDLCLRKWVYTVVEINKADPDRIFVDAFALRASGLSRVKGYIRGGDALHGCAVFVDEIVVAKAALFQDGEGAFQSRFDRGVEHDGINHRGRLTQAKIQGRAQILDGETFTRLWAKDSGRSQKGLPLSPPPHDPKHLHRADLDFHPLHTDCTHSLSVLQERLDHIEDT